MSTISNISNNLLNLLSSDNSTNSNASNSSSSSTVSSSSSTESLTNSDIDTYVSMLRSSQASLADYMGDSSSSSDSLYSVLNYNANGKVQNIIQQLSSEEETTTSNSTSTSSTDTDKASSTK